MTVYLHPVRVDQEAISSFKTGPDLNVLTHAPEGCHLMTFQPITFIHAYGLLGANPQRFGTDLKLYLATVNSFFSWHMTTTQIHVTLNRVTVTDAKRRLSEDLGVALASLFMVRAFGVVWDTIAQIPLNTKLSVKRPDFESFDAADRRYLFESKGTTVLARVEKALLKAIEQVKKYPERALYKLAIVSYLAADERLFPSQTFVVDPIALPDTVPPTGDIARLLHGEKLFEFAGLPRTAAAYVRALAAHLRQELSDENPTFAARDPVLYGTFQEERRTAGLREIEHEGRAYLGRSVASDASGASILFGVASAKLESLLLMTPGESVRDTGNRDGLGRESQLDDGSLVLISPRD